MAFLVLISGLGYVFDSLLTNFEWIGILFVAEYTFVGEIIMTFWFLVIAFDSGRGFESHLPLHK